MQFKYIIHVDYHRCSLSSKDSSSRMVRWPSPLTSHLPQPAHVRQPTRQPAPRARHDSTHVQRGDILRCAAMAWCAHGLWVRRRVSRALCRVLLFPTTPRPYSGVQPWCVLLEFSLSSTVCTAGNPTTGRCRGSVSTVRCKGVG